MRLNTCSAGHRNSTRMLRDSCGAYRDGETDVRRPIRLVVTWFTLLCFTATQTAVLAQAHDEGTAAGQAANTVIRGQITTPRATDVVPGYTTAPPESAYYGRPNLSSQASARLAACALTPNDPVCQAQRGAMSSANTSREAISPYDPAVLAALQSLTAQA